MYSTMIQPDFTDLSHFYGPATFEYQGTILNNNAATTRGRPKSSEFEDEVIAECESSLSCSRVKCSSRKRTNDYTYAHVKKCAAIVMDREYWNEDTGSFVKKWQINRTTNKLRFTNKWVFGVLRRHSTMASLGSQSYSSYEGKSSDPQDNDVSITAINDSGSSTSVKSDSIVLHGHELHLCDAMDSNEFYNSSSNEVDNSRVSAGYDDLFGFDFKWEL